MLQTPLRGARATWLVLAYGLALLLTSSCLRSGYDETARACSGVTCSGHGVCGVAPDGQARCVCDPGYLRSAPRACAPLPDAGRPDAVPDAGGRPDAGAPDTAPDAAEPEAGPADAAPDAGDAAGDGGTADVPLLDAARPDALAERGVPEAAQEDAAVPPSSCGRMSALQDDFGDGIRADQWARSYADVGASCEEINGRLEVTVPSGVIGFAGYVSAYALDLREDRAQVEVAIEEGSASSLMVSLKLHHGPQQALSMVKQGTRLISSGFVEGSSQSAVVDYDPAQHRFWRISESGGTVIWSASADGASWVQLQQLPTPSYTASLWVELSAGTSAADWAPERAQFDNFNVGGRLTPLCSADLFQDGFEDGVLGLAWHGTLPPQGPCTVQEAEGLLSFTIEGGAAASCSVRTGPAFDLRGAGVWIGVPPIASDSSDFVVRLLLADALGRSAWLGFDSGQMVAAQESLQATWPYSPDDCYWRMREQAGDIFYEISTDGAAWRSVEQVPATIDTSAVMIVLEASTSAVLTAPLALAVTGVNAP